MADPMADMLKEIKTEVRARKDAEKGSADFAKSMNAVSESGKKSHSPLNGLTGILKTVASTAMKTFSSMGQVGAVLGTVTGLLTAPMDMMQQMADMVLGFVGLVNPGAVEQFTMAMNDAGAVIGSMLTPVLKGMTIYMRMFGDVLAKLEPILQPLFDSLAQHFANLAEGHMAIFVSLFPLIQSFVDFMIPIINETSLALMKFYGMLVEIITVITELLGIDSKTRANDNASSKGRAVRQTNVQGVDAFAKSVFEKSLKGIFQTGEGKDPMQHIPDIAAAIKEGQQVVKDIKDKVTEIYNWIDRNLRGLKDTANGVKDVAGQAADAASNPIGFLGNQLGKLFVR